MKKSTIIYMAAAFALITAYLFFRIGFAATLTYYEHLIIALFGAFIWNFGLFRKEKNAAEKLKQEFDWPLYKKKHWEDWAWSFIMALPITLFMPDIVSVIQLVWDLPPYQLYYLIAGPLSMAAGYGMNWVIKRFGDE